MRSPTTSSGISTESVFALVGGAGIAMLQSRRAGEAAERTRVVKEFVTDVFRLDQDGATSNDDPQRPAEVLLEQSAQRIETRFASQPALQAELYGVVGGIFSDMAANELAADYALRQIAVMEKIGTGDAERAVAQIHLTEALYGQGRIRDARDSARIAVRLSTSVPTLRSRAMVSLAKTELYEGKEAEGLPLLDAAEAASRKDGDGPSALHAEIGALRAVQSMKANRFADGSKRFESAIDEALRAEGSSSRTAIDIRLRFARALLFADQPVKARAILDSALTTLRGRGRPGEIRAAFEEAWAISSMYFNAQVPFAEARELIERDRVMVSAPAYAVPAVIRASIAFYLGNVYTLWGDLARAEPLMAGSVPVLKQQWTDARTAARTAAIAAQTEMLAGRHREAERLFREAADRVAEQGNARRLHPLAAYNYAFSALNLVMDRRYDEADSILASAPVFGDMSGSTGKATFYRNLIPAGRARVQLERGYPLAALKLLPPMDGETTQVGYPFDDRMLRGEVLCAMGRRTEGLALLEESLRLEQPKVYAHHPFLARTQALTGLCALEAGRRKRAVELASLARESFVVQPGVSRYFVQPLDRLEHQLASTAGPS